MQEAQRRLTQWELNNIIPERGVFASGYSWVRVGEPGFYRRILEHRIVAARKLGRPLLPGETVHHIDCDKTNNHPDNLEIFPSNLAHMRRHGEMKRASPRKPREVHPRWKTPVEFGKRLAEVFCHGEENDPEWLANLVLDSPKHFRLICAGKRAVSGCRAKLWKSLLGPKTWAYCVGESDVLTEGK